MDWSFVDYLLIIVMYMFGTHSLVSKWCNATFPQIYSNEEINSSSSWMARGWVHFQHMFNFAWTTLLKVPSKRPWRILGCRFHISLWWCRRLEETRKPLQHLRCKTVCLSRFRDHIWIMCVHVYIQYVFVFTNLMVKLWQLHFHFIPLE